jgi:hypothetical protein
LVQTANPGTCNTGIGYVKRTSAGYTKITQTDLRPDAWTFEKWADLVAARDRGMGQRSVRWHYKIKIMCTIALLLSRYYDGPVVVEGNSVSLYQQSQVSLFRTMHNHIGQQALATFSAQQNESNSNAWPSTIGSENLSERMEDTSTGYSIYSSHPTLDESLPGSSRKRPFTLDNEGLQDQARSQKRGRESSVFSSAASKMSELCSGLHTW